MPEQFTRLKGFADLFGPALSAFQFLEDSARLIFPRSGFKEIRPPVVESTSLFQRGIGEDTDVVSKEMFTFADRKGRSLTLRPEATAGVLRAAINAGMAIPGQITRLFTIGPMFRYERPQKGRMRQFHQINAECLGSESPYADVELILMLLHFLSMLDLHGLTLKINSLGCHKCRPNYLKELRDFLNNQADKICEDCKRRKETNPLRVLDCKICQPLLLDAPSMEKFLCEDCQSHFTTVLDLLKIASVNYEIDPKLVRGLDYYVRTTFEVVSGEIGAQSAVAGGGRYDGLIARLGGPDVPGVGFACGMERLTLLIKERKESALDFYILPLNDACRKEAFLLAIKLRRAGFKGEISYNDAGMKSLMRQASKAGARFCFILGPDELNEQKIVLKDMERGNQQRLAIINAVDEIIRLTAV